MKNKKFTALFTAITLVFAAVPQFTVKAAALEKRDPFYHYNSGYNYYESEHFQFIWGNSGDSAKVNQAFLEGNAKNLEACWDVYMNDLDMAAPTQSVNKSLRDGKEYKTNIYISGTGLSGMADDWAYMSYDSDGFAYMFCCVDSMQYNPPSWVLPHEFGHVVTAHQLGWNENKYSYAWWEAMGNWFREQYLYSDYSNDNTGHGTDFFETYMKNLNFTFPFGRDYYAAWPFLQYLTENPDNMQGYGSDFVKKMLQEGMRDEYPFDIVDRLADADIKDTLGNFAKHMAGLDFKNGSSYRARLNELLSMGSWNWQQIYTMLEPVSGKDNVYTVPTERAPQFAGMNIIPLDIVSNSEYSVTLNGLTDIEGADWRGCVVQQASDGSCTYSELFGSGDTVKVAPQPGTDEYLVVIATPDLDTITKSGLPYGPDSEFSESKVPYSSKQQYPYSVTFSDNVSIKQRIVSANNPWESYSPHSNGGGLVSSAAKVDNTVYVGPDAKVLGSAKVTGNARIEDFAVVQDNASVSDNAVIAGNAIIAENAVISGNARVDDCALVMGRANISGNAKVIESACVYGEYTIKDYGCAKGVAFCMANGIISGQGVVDGDYYDDGGKTVTNGTAYGWVSDQSYVNSLSYDDKLMYSYDFSSNFGSSFADKYNSTYGAVFGGAEIENERTGAQGVLTLNGNKQFASLDRGILYTKNMDIQLAVLPRSSKDKQTIIYFGNDESYFSVNAFGENGTPEVNIKVNGDSPSPAFILSCETPLELGAWSVIRIVIDGSEIRMDINGKTAVKGNLPYSPDSIADSISVYDKTAAYRLGADCNNENCFNGSVDFIRIYNSEAQAPTETYSVKENPPQPTLVLIGDTDFNGKINVFDLIIIKRILIYNISVDQKILAACDTDDDGSIKINDAINLQKYLVSKISKFPAGATKSVI